MDKAAASPVTYVKIPFGNRILRSRPLENRHIYALSMTKQIKGTNARLDIINSILANVLGEDEFVAVTLDLIMETGDVSEKQVMELVTALGDATRALDAARKDADRDESGPALDVASTELRPAADE
jgi:hypothetical protein